MRPLPGGGVELDAAELRIVAALLPVAVREVERRDRVVVPGAQELAYAARLVSVGLGASVVASVTAISDAPSLRRWVPCIDCGVETDRPRRDRCDRCRKRRERAAKAG